MKDIEKYCLDEHCKLILEQYRENMPIYLKMNEIVTDVITKELGKNGIMVNSIKSRIKTEESLAGKLERKGGKYGTISDVTDIFGIRVITFFTEEVDKISALAEKVFLIDWKNSVDKRRIHELNNFGYLSLHYICSIPKSLYYNPEMPKVNELRFELQMCTALQHVWATMNHDIGYKSGVEIPREYLRGINRLAGLLELADTEFSRIRTGINKYRRNIESMMHDRNFDEIPLDIDTFCSYLKTNPFDKLTQRIAAVNQAEVHEASLIPYHKLLLKMGFKTIGDIDKLVKDYSEDAFQMATFKLGNTDLDIISSTIGIQTICEVYMIENGGGIKGLEMLFETVYGPSDYNRKRAEKTINDAKYLSFMNR